MKLPLDVPAKKRESEKVDHFNEVTKSALRGGSADPFRVRRRQAKRLPESVATMRTGIAGVGSAEASYHAIAEII
jgi:hypothetical protein